MKRTYTLSILGLLVILALVSCSSPNQETEVPGTKQPTNIPTNTLEPSETPLENTVTPSNPSTLEYDFQQAYTQRNLEVTPLSIISATLDCELKRGDVVFLGSGPMHSRGQDQSLRTVEEFGSEGIIAYENMFDTFDFSPDGNHLVTTCGEDVLSKGICVLDFAESSNCSILDSSARFEIPDLCYQPGVSTGQPKDLIDVHVEALSWSPDVQQIAFLCWDIRTLSHVCIMDLGGELTCWKDRDYALTALDWSPVGNALVVSDVRNRISLVDLKGNEILNLAVGESPRWSPDGKRIAFIKEAEGEEESSTGLFGIASIDVDGSNEQWLFKPFEYEEHKTAEERLGLRWMAFSCSDAGTDCKLSWSPDQRHLLFNTNVFNIFKVKIVQLEISTGEVFVYPEEVCSPTCSSPDWRP